MSNYLAQGLQQGWATGSQIVADGRRKKFEEEMEERRRKDQLARDAERYRQDAAMQDARLVADAKRQFGQNVFASGEADKDRGWRSGERRESQGFQAGEGQKGRDFQGAQGTLDRAARDRAQTRDLEFKRKLWEDEQPMRGFDMGLKARAAEWQENPENPYNRIREAQADKLGSDFGALPPTGGQFTGKAGSGTPTAISSQADYDRLPAGAKFIWNGRVGTKP
jgi:hypothetical protein